ncbi:MAG: trehalose-6-phosphate synthase [Geminicoccaceae bacterium]|nr:trehalose-6-phosphate synthase [Geminicoccaceae bacterium]MCS7267875.1 trehalose-6-phosphate synthase [Geminicoccaceae bacterium]MDW8124501.1 trehalose-6-phosphate synthase [Geminicoccaceae bacterium]MDW8341371.1 trehalose-6-phosphate synthase [Geminicoccaceae bacterium]
MARLVIVSNRVPAPRRGAKPEAGGLAVALTDALGRGEVLWFGWSGEIGSATAERPREIVRGRTRWVTVDLSAEDYALYYAGFANATLWPLFHYRLGLVSFQREQLEGYLRVNERFARALAPLLRPDDRIWIHDYHLIPLGRALRRLGVGNPAGFFLHVPFPPPAVVAALPRGELLFGAFQAYDLVGVQTATDAAHLEAVLAAIGVRVPVAPFPVGIDPATVARLAIRAQGEQQVAGIARTLGSRLLVLGVDRLDYSKGLPHRFEGYARLLRRAPDLRKRVTFLQLAPVGRAEVAEYRALKRELDELAGRINGEFGDIDWVPLRWVNRAVPRAVVAGLCRLARVGLVTPLRDGMNLFAKEFVAAQDPEDPGVLVLSCFAGAAFELEGAVLVNPHDPQEIAEALASALAMPLEERKARHARDRAAVELRCARSWAQGFLAALEAAAAARFAAAA